MIIDCHGHFTTAPAALGQWREQQITAFNDGMQAPRPSALQISDDEIRLAIEPWQLKFLHERGSDMILFSPIASHMGHSVGDEAVSRVWSQVANDLVHRACRLYPQHLAPVCQLPQSPGASPAGCIEELRRCVEDLGFVGCNLNPDPSGGFWRDPPITDPWWYPLYEEMVRLDVPAMIHVSGSCLHCVHTTGAHYLHGDTTAFMQMLTSDLFDRFPTLRFVIPHGGGAIPYHWGRYRGIAQDMGRDIDELLSNVFFDTCVYHSNGLEMLLKTIPSKNILFASEMLGAVRGVNPDTGHYYDDTKYYFDELDMLDPKDAQLIFEDNVRAIYPRLNAHLDALT